jgi:large subunit ribosomal protein L24
MARKKHNYKAKPVRTAIKAGDTVKVISGAHKGSQGRVIEVLRDKARVRIEDVAMQKRHLGPQKSPRHPEGGIIEGPGTVHISNVMLVSEEHGRPVRTGSTFSSEGDKKRVARGRNLKSSEV